MKKIYSTIILIMALFCFIEGYTQGRTVIRGRILDQGDKSPIIGATVVEIDKENRVVSGATTDMNGDFVYEMRKIEDKLRVSVIGYEAKEVKANATKPMVIELSSSDVAIDQVNVVAKAKSTNSLTNIEDRDKATSSVKIDLMEMQDMGVSSAIDAMQGKISGLDILSGGSAGSGSQITIRGLSSMGNSKPLIVIDGVPQSTVSKDFDLSSASGEDIGNMINIALQDIKSIEVLKDAGATAIYGSKGGDGVLLIETRRGKMGKVQFDYNYKRSMNIQPKAIPMLNGDEYIMLQLEGLHNATGRIENLPREIANDKDYADYYNYSQNTNWLDELTQIGSQNEHYFGLAGGGDKTRYSASVYYNSEDGTTINDSYQNFLTSINLDYNLSKKLQYSIEFKYQNEYNPDNLSMKAENGWEWRNVRQMAYMKAPNMSVWEYDQNGNLTGDYFTPINSYQGSGQYYYNPVAISNLGSKIEKSNRVNSAFKLRYSINDWLKFRETISLAFNSSKSNEFLPGNAVGVDWLNTFVNKASESNGMYMNIQTESSFIFNLPFDVKVHDVSGQVSWITNQDKGGNIFTSSTHLPSADIQDPALASKVDWTSSRSTDSRELSVVGNVNYKYLDRYMASATFRSDAKSSLGSENRWGAFKSLSGAWRFSDEPFLDNWYFLGESKLKASWGVSGSSPGSDRIYDRYGTYVTSDRYLGNVSVKPDQLQLDQLRWATITAYNVGLELNLFDDRVFIQPDFYYKHSTDILFYDYNIPASSGFTQLKIYNGGEMINKGWEVMFNYKIIKRKDILWSLDFNISRNINKFSKLPDNFSNEKDKALTNNSYPKLIKEGEPYGAYFGLVYDGVYSTDADAIAKDVNGHALIDSEGAPIPMTFNSYTFQGGDARYIDQNHDGKIDLNDVVYLGNPNPDFVGGFGTFFRYKRFDFSMNFNYRLGFDILNKVAMDAEGMTGKDNQSKAVLHRWRVPGSAYPDLIPRAYYNNPANNLGSSRYIESGDFIRLNNIKVSYKVPKKTCDKLKVNKLELTASARKLLTFTKYSGQDPEVQAGWDYFAIGYDNANTPPSKQFTFSVTVGF